MDALQLIKYKFNLKFYGEVQFWTNKIVTVLEKLFLGQYSALKENGKMQAHMSGRMMMDHLITNVSSKKEKCKNYVDINHKIQAQTYNPETVGSANFFTEQQNLR